LVRRSGVTESFAPTAPTPPTDHGPGFPACFSLLAHTFQAQLLNPLSSTRQGLSLQNFFHSVPWKRGYHSAYSSPLFFLSGSFSSSLREKIFFSKRSLPENSPYNLPPPVSEVYRSRQIMLRTPVFPFFTVSTLPAFPVFDSATLFHPANSLLVPHFFATPYFLFSLFPPGVRPVEISQFPSLPSRFRSPGPPTFIASILTCGKKSLLSLFSFPLSILPPCSWCFWIFPLVPVAEFPVFFNAEPSPPPFLMRRFFFPTDLAWSPPLPSLLFHGSFFLP